MADLIIQKNEFGNIKSSFDYFKKFNIDKTARILDLGCSYGSLIFNLSRCGYGNVYGIDTNYTFVEQGRKSYTAIRDNILHHDGGGLPFEDNSFDVIMMFDVIEHIPDVKRLIRTEVNRVLRKNGLFIFQTPNRYPNIIWQIINQHSLIRWTKSDHCSLQTAGTLKKILYSAGFTDVVIEKNDIITEHNVTKVKKRLGFIGPIVLRFLQKFPLIIYPNLWGNARKNNF